ncbi:hypothetical protein SAMN06265375_103102 [Muriicola jejuensis]|nr:hypothetical protein SAMN06265375_103102 [Muriicola jejuensis]
MIFLVQSFEQPRIIKKIIEASSEYSRVSAYGYMRKIHAVNNYSVLDNYENIDYRIVDTLSDGQYFKRIFSYLKLLLLLYRNYGFSRKNLYVVGIDLRFLSMLVFNAKIDYVISDIVWLYYSNPQKWFFKHLDLYMAKRSRKVYFTSRGFYDSYYKDHVSKRQLVITENKLATYGKVSSLGEIKTDSIRIAYIGAFRYENIINNLLESVRKNPNIKLNFYGDGGSSIVDTMKRHAKEYSNISFNGAFKNPDDLERIYSENNVNFVVYDNTKENERVAMPNKFYESGFFNVPIVCATNTYVGKRALEVGMGWICDIDQESINSFLNTLKMKDILDCHERIKRLDKNQFIC